MISGLFKMLPTNHSFIYSTYICIKRIWHEITYKDCYAKNPTNQLTMNQPTYIYKKIYLSPNK